MDRRIVAGRARARATAYAGEPRRNDDGTRLRDPISSGDRKRAVLVVAVGGARRSACRALRAAARRACRGRFGGRAGVGSRLRLRCDSRDCVAGCRTPGHRRRHADLPPAQRGELGRAARVVDDRHALLVVFSRVGDLRERIAGDRRYRRRRTCRLAPRRAAGVDRSLRRGAQRHAADRRNAVPRARCSQRRWPPCSSSRCKTTCGKPRCLRMR